jgi:hypothetical protein
MRLLIRAVSCTLLVGVAIPACAQPHDKHYSIRGQVVDRSTNRPIAGVDVTLEDARFYPAAAPVTADAKGRFSFAGLKAGEYVLGAMLNGWTARDGGYWTPGGWESRSVLVGPELGAKPVVLHLVRSTVLRGTVRDEYGDRMLNAKVSLVSQAWRHGRFVLDSDDAEPVDDLGRFVIRAPQPGNYKVCAFVEGTAPAMVTLDLASQDAPRYYTATCYPADGGLFRIASGESQEINLTVKANPGVSVRGRVVGESGWLRMGTELFLVHAVATKIQVASTRVRNDESFEFQNVPPGHYYVDTAFGSFVKTPITVGNSEVAGVEVHAERNAEIEVVIHPLDGRPNSVEQVRAGLRSSIAGPDDEYWQGYSDETWGPITPGRAWLLTRSWRDSRGMPPPCVASATLGGRPVLNGQIQLKSGAIERLEINLSEKCGGIKGRTVWSGKPAPFSNIAVLRSGSAKEPGDVQNRSSDVDGSFELEGLAPGEYRLWAWRENDPGPASLAEVESRATVVVVRAHQKTRATVRLIEPGIR